MAHYPDLGGLVGGTTAGAAGTAAGTGERGADAGDPVRDPARVEAARDRAGLALLDSGDREQLAGIAAAYRDRFGFPLIVCLRDAGDRTALLATARRRLDHPPAQEHATALVEIAKVAGHRYDDLVRPPGS